MSIFPVSTVIFTKSETAVLSKLGRKAMHVVDEQADKLLLTLEQHTLNG